MSDVAATQLAAPAAPQALTMADQWNFANTVAQGSLVPIAYRNSPANVLIAVGLGTSMGLSPAESLYRINVIQGKPTASAELIAAQVRKAGHKLRIAKDEAAQSVTATVVRCDDPDYPISVTRDRAWAEAMGLAAKENYVRQPMTMLTWRAITAAAREACPEALYGVAYTPDEMHDMDPAPREAAPVTVVDATPAPEPQASTQPEPQAATARLSPEQAAFMRDAAKRLATALDKDEETVARELMAAHGDPRDHLGDWDAYAAKGAETLEGMGAAPAAQAAEEPDEIEF